MATLVLIKSKARQLNLGKRRGTRGRCHDFAAKAVGQKFSYFAGLGREAWQEAAFKGRGA